MNETSKQIEIRNGLRAERITYKEVSQASREARLNAGAGYTWASIQVMLQTDRAQPELQALVIQMIDERKQRKIKFLLSEIERLKAERIELAEKLEELNVAD